MGGCSPTNKDKVLVMQTEVPAFSIESGQAWYREANALTDVPSKRKCLCQGERLLGFQSCFHACCFLKLTSLKQYPKEAYVGAAGPAPPL